MIKYTEPLLTVSHPRALVSAFYILFEVFPRFDEVLYLDMENLLRNEIHSLEKRSDTNVLCN